MRAAYAQRIETYRNLEQKVGPEQVQAIRDWVRAVAPILSEDEIGGIHHNIHGPLHLVLKTASELLGRAEEHNDEAHAFQEAKKIIVEIRKFTQEIVKYYRSREREGTKDEL